MASPTQWTWGWVDSGSWWWTGRPGMLRFMGLQRVGHNWVTELTDWLTEWSSGFPYFLQFKSEFGNKEFMVCATVSSRSCFCWLYRTSSSFGCKEHNQSDFSIDQLVMSMCRVFSCVVGIGCLLWPVHSLGKTLLVFALLHSVLQGQIYLLLQVSLDFLLLHSSTL